jgi:predicted extracellular nuclease
MTTLFVESFETDRNGTRYTTSIPEFSDGNGDFFTRTDGSNISGVYQVLNPDGSFYFTAQDINGEGADPLQTLTFSGIDISGFDNLSFSTLLAEDDASDGNQDWDNSDFVLFEYQIDGGGYNNLLAIENDGSTFNSAPLLDTNFDGIGDSTEITETFGLFTSTITETGSILDLQITFDLDSGDEDIAIDNIQIISDNATGTNLAIASTDADKAEGNTGTTPFTFTLTRSGDTTGTTAVDFTVSGDVNGADFGGSLPSGTVTFAANETSQIVTVEVAGDTDIETDESFNVTLSNPTNGATITTATANGTIQNDDGTNITLISTIQGSGASSPIVGQTVTIEAVVVGDYQQGNGTDGDLSGFFVQEQDADTDNNLTTSEGLFIFDGSSPAVDVNVGDVVEVTGEVTEFFGLTQLSNVTVSIQASDSLPTPATVNFPVTAVEDLEAYEGMQITIPDTLFVTEYFNLDRFGEVVLSSNSSSNQPGTDGRLDQYTQFNQPSVSGFNAYQADIEKRRIVLDDGQTVQNPDPIIHGRDGNPLSANNTLRGGDTVNNLSGILSFGFGDYRIQPTDPVDFQATNPRPATPDDVGGDLSVVSFNVLNFFTTLDVAGNPGSGPNNLDPRGADSQAEFDRQLDKLVTTLEIIDGDIVGLVELENEFNGDQNGDGEFAIDVLVDALNAEVGPGTYDYVNPGVPFVDTGDAISVGVIYKSDRVQIAPGTTVEILTDSDLPALGLSGPIFDGVSTNRAPIAVSFEEISTGEVFTVSVNHFKSKGGSGSGDDADIGDGQGNFNGTRLRGAEALDAWLDSDPTGSGDSDILIIGDLNAYAQEDPITFLEAEGYTDLAEEFIGDNAYSFVFDGQFGTLDYALANSSLSDQITGATEWHVNADEPDALDYNLDFGRDPSLFNGDQPYRNSDHDPLIVGLDLSSVSGATDSPDNITGTSGDDTIDALAGDDTVKGLAGDDVLLGNDDNDRLMGNRGEDTLIGGAGNDTIVGGNDNDDLIGVDPDSMSPGLGERDILRGRNDSDRFILGDTNAIYYIGNNNTDRAIIPDFELGIDTIVLPGNFEDYFVRVNNAGSTIIRDHSRDLIAVVRNVTLTESDFEFIAE